MLIAAGLSLLLPSVWRSAVVDSFEASANRILVVRQDKVAFDTQAPSVHLFPDQRLTLTGLGIDFPNMLSTIIYRHEGQTGGASYCETWSGLLPQEWGPDYPDFSPTAQQFLANQNAPPTRNLPRTLLGTVPAGTDYIDVRAKMTRSISPPQFLRTTPPVVMFPEGQWIGLRGGSCTCEYMFPLIRHFDVRLIGTSVYLDRYQSSINAGQTVTSTGGDQNGVNSTQLGEAWGNYPDSPAYWAKDCVFFESKGLDGNGNKRPPWGSTSSNSCSVGSVVDYRSHYLADLVITPGRYA